MGKNVCRLVAVVLGWVADLVLLVAGWLDPIAPTDEPAELYRVGSARGIPHVPQPLGALWPGEDPVEKAKAAGPGTYYLLSHDGSVLKAFKIEAARAVAN